MLFKDELNKFDEKELLKVANEEKESLESKVDSISLIDEFSNNLVFDCNTR